MSKQRAAVLKTKRVYEPRSEDDGFRVFVERLWPRGVTKEKAAIDLWMKEIAPSPELRKWYHHDQEKWKEFAARYRSEIHKKKELIESLKERLSDGNLTLLYASREKVFNSASVLRDFLLG
ncbi:MAG TPA: DUF488 domain-containing protein [Candidatus Kryptonia bacterium]